MSVRLQKLLFVVHKFDLATLATFGKAKFNGIFCFEAKLTGTIFPVTYVGGVAVVLTSKHGGSR